MGMILDIFKQLGANETLFYQFAIIVIMFVITKFLFLNHLQEILELREDKTVNLEGDTEKQFAEISKQENDYIEKIQKANKNIKTQIDAKKTEVIKREETEYRKHEAEINSFVEKSRKEVEEEIKAKRETVLSEAEQLATSLVQKIAKEL